MISVLSGFNQCQCQRCHASQANQACQMAVHVTHTRPACQTCVHGGNMHPPVSFVNQTCTQVLLASYVLLVRQWGLHVTNGRHSYHFPDLSVVQNSS